MSDFLVRGSLEELDPKVFELTQTTDNKDWQQINTVVDQEFSRIQSLVGKASDQATEDMLTQRINVHEKNRVDA